MKTTNARCWRNSGRSERQQGTSVRKSEAEPEFITDIRNRKQGFVLFCFCFFVCLFASLFFFKSNIRNPLFRYISLAFFFSLKCPVSPRFGSCMNWCNNNWFSTLLAIEPPVVRASVLELGGYVVSSILTQRLEFFRAYRC